MRGSAEFNAREVEREAEDLTHGHGLVSHYSSQAKKYFAEGNYSTFWDWIDGWDKFIDRLEHDGDVLSEDFRNYLKAVNGLKDLIGPDAVVPPIQVTWEEVNTLTLFDIYRNARRDVINEGLRVPACAAIYELRRGASAVQTAIQTANDSTRADQAADASRRLKVLEDVQWSVEQIQRKLNDRL